MIAGDVKSGRWVAGGREKVPSRRLPITPLFKTIRTFEGNINAEKTVFIAFNKLFTGFLIFTPCLFSRRCWLRKRYPRRFLAHFLVHFPSSPSFSTVFSFKVGTFFFRIALQPLSHRFSASSSGPSSFWRLYFSNDHSVVSAVVPKFARSYFAYFSPPFNSYDCGK